jgi:hypothetical protein
MENDNDEGNEMSLTTVPECEKQVIAINRKIMAWK